ncbi:MAG: hypothetical protein ABJE10_05890 [bacterium]
MRRIFSFSLPNVVFMFRPSVTLRSLPLFTLAAVFILGGCADKNVPPAAGTPAGRTSASGEVSKDSGAASAATSASSPAAVAAAASAAAPKPGVADTGVVIGEIPKRPRRDSVALASMTKPETTLDAKWPVKMPEPLPGALLPTNRIIAFYGNPAEKRMGALGEYPKDVMLAMLDKEVARWRKADPTHPVIPALHLVATVAQGAPGKNGLYRLRMRDAMVDTLYAWAKAHHAIFFVDVQLGKDNVRNELPRFKPWLENPDVHLAIDPEFAMEASGAVPSTRVGTLDAKDINWAVDFLDQIAKEKNLPPKILIVHRWTRKMVTNAKDIHFTPHVQVVMDMDGWGPPWLKFDSYHDYVKAEPVQFTGFKLFFHNDTKKGDLLLTPAEVLRLNPRPLYIQYQ